LHCSESYETLTASIKGVSLMQTDLDLARSVIERFKALIPTDHPKAYAPEFTAACEIVDAFDPVAYRRVEGWLKERRVGVGAWRNYVRAARAKRIAEAKALAAPEPTTETTVAEPAQPEPWDQPVNGDDLLFAIYDFLTRHLVASPSAFVGITLWIALTHLLDAARIATRLAITSPAPETGKTTLLDILAVLVRRPFSSSNLTGPLAFRVIEKEHPTLLIDEADSFAANDETLRGILNSGHARNGTADRLERDAVGNFQPKKFSTWGAAAIAGIGKQSATWMSRAIEIKMERKLPNQHVEPLGAWDDDALAEARVIVRKLVRWSIDSCETIKTRRPVFPAGIGNRTADNWRTPLAIAEIAGGGWPARARDAAVALTRINIAGKTLSERLLADIKAVFAEQKIDRSVGSGTLCRHLARLGGVWAEMPDSHKPITETQLAALLDDYGIGPKSVRVGKWTGKGYKPDAFTHAFSRYTRMGGGGRHTATTVASVGESESDAATSGATQPPHKTPGRHIDDALSDRDARRPTEAQVEAWRAEADLLTAATATEPEPERNDDGDDPEVPF
jgi:Protein of unknown function (DUF3631)